AQHGSPQVRAHAVGRHRRAARLAHAVGSVARRLLPAHDPATAGTLRSARLLPLAPRATLLPPILLPSPPHPRAPEGARAWSTSRARTWARQRSPRTAEKRSSDGSATATRKPSSAEATGQTLSSAATALLSKVVAR